MTSPPEIRTFHCVDILRGLAAYVIVIFHYHHFYMPQAQNYDAVPDISTFPYAAALRPFYAQGAANAVELFWIISGFVFAHVYLKRRASLYEFSVARFSRLYPMHFATLLLVAGLQAISLQQLGHWQIYANNDVKHFVLQLFFASNWTSVAHGLSFNGPIWSVSLEMIVYALFFLSLFALRRHPVAVALVLMGASWAVWAGGVSPVPYIALPVFECAGYFFLGCAVYSLTVPSADRRRRVMCALPVAVGLGVAFYMLGWTAPLVAATCCAVLLLAIWMDFTVGARAAKLSAIGGISYSIYLVHIPVQLTMLLAVDLFGPGTRDFADSPILLPIYLVLATLAALMSTYYIEKPAQRILRRRLSGQPRRVSG